MSEAYHWGSEKSWACDTGNTRGPKPIQSKIIYIILWKWLAPPIMEPMGGKAYIRQKEQVATYGYILRDRHGPMGVCVKYIPDMIL